MKNIRIRNIYIKTSLKINLNSSSVNQYLGSYTQARLVKPPTCTSPKKRVRISWKAALTCSSPKRTRCRRLFSINLSPTPQSSISSNCKNSFSSFARSQGLSSLSSSRRLSRDYFFYCLTWIFWSTVSMVKKR